MRARDTQRQIGAVWKGKAGKSREMKLSVKSRLAVLKPLAGKVFYLDLPSNRKAESLEKDIKHLGGNVDKFFSKDITYLVSNKRETKYVQCLRQDFPQSASSPCPHSNQPQPDCGCDDAKNRSQGQADSDILQTDKILSKALEWGVKIFYIDEVLAYIKKKKKTIASQRPITAAAKTVKHASTAELTCQESKGGRIGKPFVKVEDSSRHYRPIYVTMTKMPELNLKTLAPRCPFVVTGEKSAGDKERVNKTVKAKGQASGRKNYKNKEGSGYCQCCMDKYENLISHLQSERHRAFSKSEAYQVLNQLVSPLQRSFTRSNTFIKRHKSSVSSVQLDTGPFGGLDIRATEIIKEEQQPHDCPMEFSFPSTSGLQSASQVPTSLTASLSSNLRRVSHKRPSRRNLMTLSPPKAAQETRPSSGENLARSPVLIPQVNVDVHVPHEDARSPQEPLCESYLESPSAVTNQQEDTNRSKRSPGKAVGNGEHLSSPSCSPAETVRRKVRVYKRQKWKFDTTREEHVKRNDTCDNSPKRSGNFFSPLIKGDVELAQI
ncbi:protein DBF4 homolog A isoform X2 [Syngnathus scovelli]|uniref:protein DBF4 homolog A isoform X2 n=1 Tax=Syngnathus scovelli TaxID=161590 RepID=UPI002110ADF3|nr:protein DBF4 homolog A isoform X2 [Syngnathus scovelli]